MNQAITIYLSETTVAVQAPYAEHMICVYREQGGQWDSERRIWVFDVAAMSDSQYRNWMQSLERKLARQMRGYVVTQVEGLPEMHAATPASESEICERCGAHSHHLMSSSTRGALCPRCYDAVEAEA